MCYRNFTRCRFMLGYEKDMKKTCVMTRGEKKKLLYSTRSLLYIRRFHRIYTCIRDFVIRLFPCDIRICSLVKRASSSRSLFAPATPRSCNMRISVLIFSSFFFPSHYLHSNKSVFPLRYLRACVHARGFNEKRSSLYFLRSEKWRWQKDVTWRLHLSLWIDYACDYVMVPITNFAPLHILSK